MTKNLTYPILLLITLLYSNVSQAQIPAAPVNAQSPNAASLGLYGDIPVSYYTGVPNISIPLYTLEHGGISVPVSLSYHASGFRPDMHPGWVGMGFSLNAGGVISRNVKDSPDDFSNENLPAGLNRGFYYAHSLVAAGDWNQIPYIQALAQSDYSYYDSEPDEFSFSFGPYSGSFYLDHNLNWQVKSDAPLKVTFNGVFGDNPFPVTHGTAIEVYGSSKTFSGFTITAEDGTQYIFGGSTDAIEYSMDFFRQASEDWTAGSWYLTKIINPGGQQVDFIYERDNYINQMYISVNHDLGTRTTNSGGILEPACNSMTYYPIYASYQGKLVAPVYLKQINTADAVMKFNRSTSNELRYPQAIYAYQSNQTGQLSFLPVLGNNAVYYPQSLDLLQWKKLDEIRVERPDGTLLRQFYMGYNNNANERLTMQSLVELGSDGTAKPPYQFFYDNSKPLPDYLANMTDHWGFYNGTYADISNQNNYYNTYYGYRQPNAAYLLTGTLNKVIYPTGGVTEFTFEPNSYRKQIGLDRSQSPQVLSSDMLAGGIRIKKISSYDVTNPYQKIEKEYFYITNYPNTASPVGSGVLGGQIKYYFNDYRVRAFNDNNVVYSKALFSSQSVLPGCVNAQGSHVGYSQVVEKLYDGSYKIYQFSNYDTGSTDEPADNNLQVFRTEYEPYSSNEESRGKLLGEQSYDASNHLINSRQIQYIALNKATSYVRAIKARFFTVCPETAVSVSEATAYKNYYYSYKPISETNTLYDPAGYGVIANTSYSYNSYKLLSTKTQTNSIGETIQTSYKYPADYTDAISSAMVSANIVAPVIETAEFDNGTLASLTHTNYYSPYSGLYRPSNVQLQVAGNPLETRQQFHQYDTYGNILEQSKVNGTHDVYLWGYHSLYPVAIIKNSTYGSVQQAMSLNGITQAQLDNAATSTDAQMRTLLNSLRTSLPAAQVSTYTYSPLRGMTSATDAKNQTVYYEYDSFQRLMDIKDKDVNMVKHYDYHYQGQ